MVKRTGKRLAMTIFEIIAEAVFLGILFGLLILPGIPTPTLKLSLGVLAVSAGPVVLVLYLWGYYLTRPLVGLFGRVHRTWVYGAIAAGLFATHIFVAILRLRPDLSHEAKAVTVPFLAGGAVIVFFCASYGQRLLLRWTR